MILEGWKRTGMTGERADVVVVGTGAGGGTLAAYLAERGWDVVMVERGGFHTAESFTQDERGAMAEFNGRGGADSTVDNAVLFSYAETVGGTTVHYWGDSIRTPDDRLERWRTEHGLEWATPGALRPHFEAVERELGIHPAEDGLFNENNRLVRTGCETLGWEGFTVPTARVDCIGCGWTQLGCAYNRKSSQLITTIPRVSRAGGRIYSDARAERVIVENGRAIGVEGSFLARGNGERPAVGRFRVDADHVVVAGGSLGTAELLLRSLDDHTVGRRLYINPSFNVWADFGRDIDNHTGIPCAYVVHEWRGVRRRSDGRYAGGGYIMLCNHQQPGSTAALLGQVGPRHTDRMGRWHQLGSVLSVIDEVNPGRVFLDDDGYRRTSYRVRGEDALKAVDYLRNASRIFLAAGAREVWIPDVWGTRVRNEREVESLITLRSVEPNSQVCLGTHLMGTAPMGSDAEDSFASPSGEAHRVENLHVADGAALPGSISVDPSLTIMAFARRLAEEMHSR